MSDGGWGVIMPKYNITFDMEDPFEQELFKYAHTGLDVRLAVSAFAEELRDIERNWDEDIYEPRATIREVRDMLWKHFEEHKVDWEVV
jgi:hypothetical protein